MSREPDSIPIALSARLVCKWQGNPRELLRTLAHLAGDTQHTLGIELSTGERARHLSVDEICAAFDSAAARLFTIQGPDGVTWLRAPIHETTEIELATSWEEFSHDTWWLQNAREDTAANTRSVGLPLGRHGLARDGVHAIVAIAKQTAELSRAELILGESVVARWDDVSVGNGLSPVNGTPLWTVRPGDGLLSFVDLGTSTRGWDVALLRSQLLELVGAAEVDLAACAQAVATHLGVGAFVLEHDGTARWMTLVPDADRVIVRLPTGLTGEDLVDAVLHAGAHLALGHVRSGDRRAHVDDLSTLKDARPLRAWDRAVRELLGDAAPGGHRRQVEKLEDCTPEEKACLGLWRMIGEVLGESQRLHEQADRYQVALYQRQAAQRLLAQLEEYRGAMLCDGVGLGKTYVATTLIVHYANWWQERLRTQATPNIQDRFRVAILTPQSVVSTWHREALPALGAFGVNRNDLRVFSHAKLSRITKSSEVLERRNNDDSDLEHLMLADLVIVDEAHNFRSISARRTRILRDLLRLQPRRDERRRVLLVTATPINNSLDDLMQEVSLLFSRPLWLHDSNDPETYRRNALKTVRDRCTKARNAKHSLGDVSPFLVHGKPDARFAETLELRDDLKLGPRIADLAKYLREQDDKLKGLQERARALAHTGNSLASEDQRVAEDLLDRIVVQRSRDLCKAIEREHGSGVELLFRPDAKPPERLHYADAYDDTKDVLASLLPLFDLKTEASNEAPSKLSPLSLKVYMWHSVREGTASPDDVSSVVGLQRALILKRLESSPVSFLITLLRLTVLHAHHLQKLHDLCAVAQDKGKVRNLQSAMKALLVGTSTDALQKVRLLATGKQEHQPGAKFFQELSRCYVGGGVADPDDPPPQLQIVYEAEDAPERAQLERLWGIRDALLEDMRTLLSVTPRLAGIVFGKFSTDEWPKRLTSKDSEVDWPTSSGWGQRVVSDPKLRRLIERLLLARRRGQKAIVFSQFSDTLTYLQSVLRACKDFDRQDWATVLRGFTTVEGVTELELRDLIARTSVVTGDHPDRDGVINTFAPYYRLGPTPPVDEGDLSAAWECGWRDAIEKPVDVLLATDILAEGVNLQDVAVLINYDVHWNPVRMIQRAGRIDRRLKPEIEKASSFPYIEELARFLNKPAPPYYFTGRAEAPTTVNMILPDELERELLLRERIALKTLAIDFTLGLERGTGAEADWMNEYVYQGVSSLNAFQRDRAIEQVAGYHRRLTRFLSERRIETTWSDALNAWLRERGGGDDAPFLARAAIGRRGAEARLFTRALKPALHEGVPHWLWTFQKPGESLHNVWLSLDGKTWPPLTTSSIPWSVAASEPISAVMLLGAAVALLDREVRVDPMPRSSGNVLQQGLTAISAGFFETEEARTNVVAKSAFLLQLRKFDPSVLTKDPETRE